MKEIAALVCSLVLISCQQKPDASGFTQPLPTKDEVAIVGTKRLTVTTVENIKSRLAKEHKKHAAWIAKVALAVPQKHTFSVEQALQLARHALGIQKITPQERPSFVVVKKWDAHSVKSWLNHQLQELKVVENREAIEALGQVE